jgi:hypothetical protein
MRNREQQKPTFKKVIETEIDFKTAVVEPTTLQATCDIFKDKAAHEAQEKANDKYIKEYKAAQKAHADFNAKVEKWQKEGAKDSGRAALLQERALLPKMPEKPQMDSECCTTATYTIVVNDVIKAEILKQING